MALENLRVCETIYPDDPRFAEIEPYATTMELELFRGHWYDRDTREPVSFSSEAEAQRWFRDNVRVGDYIEVEHFDQSGKIVEITDTHFRIENWRARRRHKLDPDYVAEHLQTWQRK